LYGQVTYDGVASTEEKVISFSMYDGSRFQRMRHTWNMKEDVNYKSSYGASDVADSTVYNYGPENAESQYLKNSTSLYGQVTYDGLSETGENVISYTVHDQTHFQRMRYTWNMKENIGYMENGTYGEYTGEGDYISYVADSTIYYYGPEGAESQYLKSSTSLYNQVTYTDVASTTKM
jgi:hypothetical protein